MLLVVQGVLKDQQSHLILDFPADQKGLEGLVGQEVLAVPTDLVGQMDQLDQRDLEGLVDRDYQKNQKILDHQVDQEILMVQVVQEVQLNLGSQNHLGNQSVLIVRVVLGCLVILVDQSNH